MTRYARQERRALCDTLLDVGPDAPTLCDPWRTRDLAAHLVLRDSRLDLTLGQWVPPLKGRLEDAMADRAAQDWHHLVEQVRQGPPVWSPARLDPVAEAVDKVEYFVHHEDVLRATPGFTPRALDRGLERALWRSLRAGAKLLFRRAPVGLVLAADDIGRYAVKDGGEQGTVVVRGRAGELLLYAYGRARVADVRVEGPLEALTRLQEARPRNF